MSSFKLKAFAVGAAGLAAVCSAGQASAACQLVQAAEFHVAMVDNRPLADGAINGKPVKFLIDLTSTHTFIWRSTAANLGLTPRTTNVVVYGIGSRAQATASQAKVAELKLGNSVAHDVPLWVVADGSSSGGADGVIGEDFLSKFDVEFDFTNGAMRLFQTPKGCAGDQVVYWNKDYSLATFSINSDNAGLVIIDVKLNGKKTTAVLATNAGASAVTTGAATRAGVTPAQDGAGLTSIVAGLGATPVQASAGVFPTFTVGEESIKNAKLEVANVFGATAAGGAAPKFAAATGPEMLLGADFFQSHRIYLARGQGKVYFSYVGGPVFKILAANADPAPAAKP